MADFVWPPEGGSGSASSGSQSVTIASGASTKAVTFTTAFGSSNYVPLVSISNVVDATPIFLQAIITAKSSTGFTATFNAPTDTANYVLEYAILGYV